jgi:four helix bundle protein
MDTKSGFVRSFEDLEVFKRAYALSLEIHRVSLGFPQAEQMVLGRQARRASKSICANIAEGFGKQPHSKAEFRRYLLIALGSANEMLVWTRYCLDLGYIDAMRRDRWHGEYDQIARMLNGLISKLHRFNS